MPSTHSALWRHALLLVVVIPFLPEITILVTSGVATLSGCGPAGDPACSQGPTFASITRVSLQVAWLIGRSFGHGLAAIWLLMCYVAIGRGWSGSASRLWLGAAVSFLFALLPYVGPWLSILPLVNPRCPSLNVGLVGPCEIYGGNVGSPAHATVTLDGLVLYGIPIAIFSIVLFAIVLRRTTRRGAQRPA